MMPDDDRVELSTDLGEAVELSCEAVVGRTEAASWLQGRRREARLSPLYSKMSMMECVE